MVTGLIGFIGFHLTKQLLKKNFYVYGIDNINNYYSVNYKKDRLRFLKSHKNFNFENIDLCDNEKISKFLKKNLLMSTIWQHRKKDIL